ncbi:thioredoxin family protein [Clostridium sp. LIBA-8841]|uniref:TlpA family protein disulfide reductase n=1 Tax=Clostridium sp. LIBA-8841 TaxID=2987530 RepID=UPI002AC4268B|nr:thioredoxin family protein [Clostridium sp. LIBA-8841]MDZ5254727.1 thioredoxin family protein [Clostridium sp. LIBA-8841]
MRNKRNVIILFLIVFSLVGIYFGKNYIEKKKQTSDSEINVISNLEDAKVGVPTIIMFKTDTCPYCVEMQKELSNVAKDRKGAFNIYYARLEEDKNMDLAYKYGANVVPTTVFLDKDGKEFYTHQGLMRASSIETILNSLGVK